MRQNRSAMDEVTIRELAPDEFGAAIPALAALVVDAVEGGASVNFVAGVTLEEAAAWWHERAGSAADGTMRIVVAATPGPVSEIVGCTILVGTRNPNALHRAEVGKVIVARGWRRRGIGRALMAATERVAEREGRWLLVLDTTVGSEADALYRALGWTELGTMPNHARTPDGRLAATTYFWKDLRDAGRGSPPPPMDRARSTTTGA